MTIQTTYSNARENFSALLNEVSSNQEIVIINRRGHDSVALVSATELASLMETAHLLRSPENARRLLKSLHRALTKTTKPESLEQLREELGLGEKVS